MYGCREKYSPQTVLRMIRNMRELQRLIPMSWTKERDRNKSRVFYWEEKSFFLNVYTHLSLLYYFFSDTGRVQ